MNYTLASYSAKGKRSNNEDACAALCEGADGLLASVADGLGGSAFGEKASALAVRALEERLKGREVSARLLEEAIRATDEAVRALQWDYPGAMTTIAALWLRGTAAVAAHVGDTRIYQFRDGQIVYQSLDHSLAQLAVRDGEITPAEIRSYPERNVLFRALGGKGGTKAELRELRIRPGDRLLLCSDGFWETVTEEEMLRAARESRTAEEWLDKMRLLAERGEDDNHTAVAAVFEEEREESER